MQLYVYGAHLRFHFENFSFWYENAEGIEERFDKDVLYARVSFKGMVAPQKGLALTGSEVKTNVTLWMGNDAEAKDFIDIEALQRKLEKMLKSAPPETFLIDAIYNGKWTDAERTRNTRSCLVFDLPRRNQMFIGLMQSLFLTIQRDTLVKGWLYNWHLRLRDSCVTLVSTKDSDLLLMLDLNEAERRLKYPETGKVLFCNLPQMSEGAMITWRCNNRMQGLMLNVLTNYDGVRQEACANITSTPLIVKVITATNDAQWTQMVQEEEGTWTSAHDDICVSSDESDGGCGYDPVFNCSCFGKCKCMPGLDTMDISTMYNCYGDIVEMKDRHLYKGCLLRHVNFPTIYYLEGNEVAWKDRHGYGYKDLRYSKDDSLYHCR